MKDLICMVALGVGTLGGLRLISWNTRRIWEAQLREGCSVPEDTAGMPEWLAALNEQDLGLLTLARFNARQGRRGSARASEWGTPVEWKP